MASDNMTAFERQFKRTLKHMLKEQGYGPYAKLLDLFDLHIAYGGSYKGTPVPTAGILLGKGEIVINPDYNKEILTFFIRHEIMHEYLAHLDRMMKKFNVEYGKDSDVDEAREKLFKTPGFIHKVANYAEDYEISDLSYTPEDIELTKQIGGLVLAEDHPDWLGLSAEELYDKLKEFAD